MTRRRSIAYVHPTGHRPYGDPAQLDYRNNAELKTQLIQYVRSKWTTATRVAVDLGTNQILIDGKVAAGFAITDYRSTPDQNGPKP